MVKRQALKLVLDENAILDKDPESVEEVQLKIRFLVPFFGMYSDNKPFWTFQCACVRTAKQGVICSRNQTIKHATCKRFLNDVSMLAVVTRQIN